MIRLLSGNPWRRRPDGVLSNIRERGRGILSGNELRKGVLTGLEWRTVGHGHPGHLAALGGSPYRLVKAAHLTILSDNM
jgi:hypothetical protein